MEDDQAPGAYVRGELPEHRRGILLKLQNVPANDGIEGALERHLGRITLAKDHAPQRPGSRSRPRRFERRRNAVYADNLAGVTDYGRRKKRNVADAATDIEHAHAGDDPGLAKEALRDRIDEARLRPQTIELAIGMTKHIGTRRSSVVTGIIHRQLSALPKGSARPTRLISSQ
jgi:hypothetical protein